jgi:hypothetical protein
MVSMSWCARLSGAVSGAPQVTDMSWDRFVCMRGEGSKRRAIRPVLDRAGGCCGVPRSAAHARHSRVTGIAASRDGLGHQLAMARRRRAASS